MTNYPPPYGQQPQPPQGPYGQPPYGQPPMPYGQSGAVAMPPQSNGWSVAALVTGLLGFCTLGISGLLAVIFGFLGIKRAGVTRSGKGMSIAGIILGLGSIALWILCGGAIYAAFKGTEANRELSERFLKDLATGNLTSAATAVDSSAINQDDLQKLSDLVKPMGPVQAVTIERIDMKADQSSSVFSSGGRIVFQSGQTKTYDIRQSKKGESWIIVYVKIQ